MGFAARFTRCLVALAASLFVDACSKEDVSGAIVRQPEFHIEQVDTTGKVKYPATPTAPSAFHVDFVFENDHHPLPDHLREGFVTVHAFAESADGSLLSTKKSGPIASRLKVPNFEQTPQSVAVANDPEIAGDPVRFYVVLDLTLKPAPGKPPAERHITFLGILDPKSSGRTKLIALDE